MNTALVRRDWEALAGRRAEFTKNFYDAFFDAFPEYRKLFPAAMDAQMERMVEMFSNLARFAEHTDLIQPYLLQIGFAHRRFGLHAEDAENFKNVFIATLADALEGSWSAEHEAAWRSAFDDILLPMFDEGLERGRREDEGPADADEG